MHDLAAATLDFIGVESEFLYNLPGVVCYTTSFRYSEVVVLIVDGPEFGQNCHVTPQGREQGVMLIVRKTGLTLMENPIGCF